MSLQQWARKIQASLEMMPSAPAFELDVHPDASNTVSLFDALEQMGASLQAISATLRKQMPFDARISVEDVLLTAEDVATGEREKKPTPPPKPQLPAPAASIEEPPPPQEEEEKGEERPVAVTNRTEVLGALRRVVEPADRAVDLGKFIRGDAHGVSPTAGMTGALLGVSPHAHRKSMSVESNYIAMRLKAAPRFLDGGGGGGGGGANAGGASSSDPAASAALLGSSPTVTHRIPPYKEGFLEKLGAKRLKQWQQRWFVLKNNFLVYQRHPDDDKVLGSIDMEKYEVVRSKESPLQFMLLRWGHKTIRMRALNERDMDGWLSALTEARELIREQELARTRRQEKEQANSALELNKTAFSMLNKKGWLAKLPTSYLKSFGWRYRKNDGWKKRWFALQGAHLAYYKSESDHRSNNPIKRVYLVDCEVDDPDPLNEAQAAGSAYGHLFDVHTTDNVQLRMSASSREEKQEWMRALQHASQYNPTTAVQ